MTDIKSTIAELRYLADWAQHHLDKAKIANDAAEAIEALQGEVERLKRSIRIEEEARDKVEIERDALADKLDELQRQEPVIDFTVLHQFANDQAISYNKLCTAVRMCLAAPKALEPEQLPEFVLVQRKGFVPKRKGPFFDSKHTVQMLRELYEINPDYICTVIEAPDTTYPESGIEYLQRYEAAHGITKGTP